MGGNALQETHDSLRGLFFQECFLQVNSAAGSYGSDVNRKLIGGVGVAFGDGVYEQGNTELR